MTTVEQPQHLQALARANKIRWARADLKRQVARGETSAAAVLDLAGDIPACAETMPIMELLAAQRGWGRVRCQRLLGPLRIGEKRHLGELTRRQRGAIVVALGDAVAGRNRPLAA